VVLRCSAVTDEHETLTVEWRQDGVPINLRTSTHIRLNESDNSLIIERAVVVDTAEFTCHAGNGLDEVASSPATVIVRGRSTVD